MSDFKDRPLPWWPRSFTADERVQGMSFEAEAIYRRLLDHQWLHGSIPADLKQIARICKNADVRRIMRLWNEIAPCFHHQNGDTTRLINHKMERERAKDLAYREERRQSGRKGGIARGQKASSANAGGMLGEQAELEAELEAEPLFSLKPPTPTPTRTTKTAKTSSTISTGETARASASMGRARTSSPNRKRQPQQPSTPEPVSAEDLDQFVATLKRTNAENQQQDQASLDQRVSHGPKP